MEMTGQRPRGRPRKYPSQQTMMTGKRPRGRPRKNPSQQMMTGKRPRGRPRKNSSQQTKTAENENGNENENENEKENENENEKEKEKEREEEKEKENVEENEKKQEKEKEGSSTDFDGETMNDGVRVSMFDYSVENYFQAIDMISSICGTADEETFEPNEIQRFSSAITFLTEWKHFYYQPKTVRFAYETGSPHEKDVINGISLPQFSAANVPKMEGQSSNRRFGNSSKDFVLHVGGHVWGLDWCPRIHQRPDYHSKCEYLAVAAHPPDSSYHKMGAPLIGRGVIQIWGVLNADVEEPSPWKSEEPSSSKSKRRGRKRLVRTESLDDLVGDELSVNKFVSTPGVGKYVLGYSAPGDELEIEACKGFPHGVVACKLGSPTSSRKRRMKDNARGGVCNDSLSPTLAVVSVDNTTIEANDGCDEVVMASNKRSARQRASRACMTSSVLSKDVALPRLVLCLAHNAKVAWDVKWRPSNANDPEHKHHMGYLAVLLGNGSLEVWEVPFPWMIKILYTSLCKPGTDPRFVKLEPVFRCSKIKCGDRQSIPLTVEWSTSAPHDLLLAGCHDGTVAMWKFSARGSSEDTRPLLCFKADTVPIRALAWAPDESDVESANLIVTAGHEGLRFWDIRDPYRPLWDLNPVRRVLSLDWLRDPRCLILSVDDGTLRILSLLKSANDVPVTGKSFVGTQQQGFHSYYCSSFSIWSIQVSRFTGQVAYCGADGSALRFQLTSKAVEKDPMRNKAPHFLCGSLTIEDSTLTINTPLPNVPFPMKKSLNEWANTPRSIRGFQTTLIQEKGRQVQTLGSSNFLVAPGNKAPKPKAPKPKASRKKKDSSKECLVGEEEEQENACGSGDPAEFKVDFEVLPPKTLAMHRVRWNMNKGSERWLCYGGAAGIVRCQEINFSTVS